MATLFHRGCTVSCLVKRLEQLTVRGWRNTHTASLRVLQVDNVPACLAVQPSSGRYDQSMSLPVASQTDKLCSAFNKIEILDKIQPVTIIDMPNEHGSNASITDPLSVTIKPFENPVANKITIKPPSANTPKSASKNGNKIMLKIKRRRRKYRQLLKVRQRIWPIRRKINFLKMQQRERQIEAQCDLYKKEAEKFDFFAIVKRDLDAAKKNGYVYKMVVDFDEPRKKQKLEKKQEKSLGSVLDAMKNRKQKQKNNSRK